MYRYLLAVLVSCLTQSVFVNSTVNARDLTCEQSARVSSMAMVTDDVINAYAFYDIGNWNLTVTNRGVWGESYTMLPDYFTGDVRTHGSEYPKHSSIYSLNYATFWVGGILGSDTLVSAGLQSVDNSSTFEFTPDPASVDAMERRSVVRPEWPGYEAAVSEQDFIAVYTDTFVDETALSDYLRQTPHQPLHVQITQKSYAWSNELVNDIIFFDLTVKNIGKETIYDTYVGVLSRPSLGLDFYSPEG